MAPCRCAWLNAEAIRSVEAVPYMTVLEPILGITPFERPDASLVIALAAWRGAVGILDLGRDPSAAERALALVRRSVKSFGVRLGRGVEMALPNEATVVVVDAASAAEAVARYAGRAVLVQVTSIEEARAAVATGANGILAKGSEAGGRVGDEPSLILLQRILREVPASMPVWSQGGAGLHTAAACIAAGARGVVLDAQLALLPEASTSEKTRRAISAMDGSETRVVAGHRIYSSPTAATPPPGVTEDEIARSFGADDPQVDLLPLGQDAAFARVFAEKMGSVERVVRRLRAAMAANVRSAAAVDPLRPHSPFATLHGITYPIAQGPMTRVSDRAAFAESVSRAGALPFLALSLMRAPEARPLLEETAKLLAGRAWGVGVLGFVPPEIRDEQLALILEMRPTVALIAGGRPSLARPLEQAGIATYLHVPSPGLLDMFLKDGARRFVFEGRECGAGTSARVRASCCGESAIERLLEDEAVGDVSVLLRRGHPRLALGRDGERDRGAARRARREGRRPHGDGVPLHRGGHRERRDPPHVPGRVAPLRAHDPPRDRARPRDALRGDGVRAGVRRGARAAREGRKGAPGDLGSPRAAQPPGGLRIATKGAHAEGRRRRLRPGERAARRGDVHARAGRRPPRPALYDGGAPPRRVRGGARVPREGRASASPRAAGSRGRRRRIIGIACIFPDAPDKEAFWKNVVLGKNSIREVSKERWNPELYYDAKGSGEKTPSKWGGFLPEVCFDAGAYGIPPRSVPAIDPVQLLSLDIARKALDDAGYGEGRVFDRERTSVIFGAQTGTELTNGYAFRATFPQFLGEIPEALDAHLPKLTEDSFAGVLSNVIAGRIANRLDLGGVNYTVDAACASSLAAIDMACKELAAGTSDMVIGGGADLHNSVNDYLLFASVHALSPRGQCRTFDASADGIALGEGVAAVVLKRLEDAERDGDRVYAVIKSVGGASDGKSLGLTAPRKEGQARALGRAYELAGISPADVGLVEAHGTGTVVGDKTELAALTEFFAAEGAAPQASTLGSVKSNIGHTKCAAGLAGLIKVALSVHRGVLPPTLNVEAPNPYYKAKASPFAFRKEAAPWASEKRVAGVSAFGFGGTNFHAVVAQAPASSSGAGLDEWPSELFLFRGRDRATAARTMASLAALVQAGTDQRLRDLARGVAETHAGEPVQAAIVARDVSELADKLLALSRGEARRDQGVFVAGETYRADQVAFVFPGQGSQRPGMLADLFVAFPALHDLLRLGARWTSAIFPPAAFGDSDRAAQRAAITDTRVAQPALAMAGLAMARLLGCFGVRPQMVAGHSHGELVALAVAGALPAEKLLELSAARADAILDAARGAPGTMAAVSGAPEAVRSALADVAGVTLANLNAPEQTVIAGSKEAIASALSALAVAGFSAKTIPVACAFHSPIVAGASASFARTLAALDVHAPAIPVYANATAAPYPSGAEEIRDLLSRQLALPVRFADEIERMYADGARVFVEAGPGGVLTDLVGRILKGRPHVAVRCDKSGVQGIEGLLTALAELAVAGVAVDSSALFEGRDARTFDLASPPARKAPKAGWMVSGHGVRPLEGELPDFALRIPAEPLALLAPASASAPPTEREDAIFEYLRGMRELVDGQRQVMLRYLGEAAPAQLEAAAALPARTAPSSSVRRSAPKAAAAPVLQAAPADRPRLRPLEALIEAVSQRTGYPPEMLDPGLDLEADLGIDSIKRIEILGMMRDRLGIDLEGEGREGSLEEIAGFKTLGKIAEWLEARLGEPAPTSAVTPEVLSSVIEPEPLSQEVVASVGRYVFEVSTVPAAVPNGIRVAGHTFALVPDRLGVAEELTALLESHGARVRHVASGDAVGEADGVVHLASLASESHDDLRGLFGVAQDAVKGNARWLVAATGLGGSFGRHVGAAPALGGVAGLLKSVAKERPGLRVCALDLDATESPSELARYLYAELLADEPLVEVGYARGGTRQVLRVVEREGPASDAPLALDKDAVVLVTGGARGITAEVSVALAGRFGCHFELVGRTALGEDEDAELARAEDAIAIRRLLLERANGAGRTTPAAIERACRSVLASREIRRTLARIEANGGRAHYHAIDVRDGSALGALVDRIYAAAAWPARRRHSRRRRHRGQAPRREDARVVRSRLRHEGDERAHARREAQGLREIRGPLLQRLGRLREPRPGRLRGGERRARQARAPVEPQHGQDAGPVDQLGSVGRRRDGLARSRARVRAPRRAGHSARQRRRALRRRARDGARGAGNPRCPARVRLRVSALDIAVVGMGALFPGARDLDHYERNLRAGFDAISDVPPGRWDPVFYDPGSSSIDRLYCKRGGFVDENATFDPIAFGVMPVAARGAEPDQLLCLEVATRAMKDAGYDTRSFARDRAGVILGRGSYASAGRTRLEQRVRTIEQVIVCLRALLPNLREAELARVRADLAAQAKEASADAAIGLVPNLAASRLAHHLDLAGPAFTVDAACASSLVAIDQACRELASAAAI